MVKRVPALKARQQLGTLLDDVRYRGTEVIVERSGRPVAVVVPIEAYERYRRLREQAFDRIDAVRERLAGELRPRDLEALVEEEARTVRKRK